MEPSPAQRAARDRIAAGLAQAGFALPGTLTVRSYACGKPGGRCHADPPRLHGPYAEWTRKIGGKTVTRRLTPAELAEYQPLFDNAKIKSFVPGWHAQIPFAEGIRRTVAWFDADPARQAVDQAADARVDEIVRAWQR